LYTFGLFPQLAKHKTVLPKNKDKENGEKKVVKNGGETVDLRE